MIKCTDCNGTGWNAKADRECETCVGFGQMPKDSKNHVPNLDAMSPDDLNAFYAKYARPSLKDAEYVTGDRRKGFTVIVARLAAYANNKAVAMQCRKKGKIVAAQIYEKICEDIYERIPQDLRW